MSSVLDASLIVSVYNQQSWAPIVLDSIAAQTGGVSFEVIVADDGSSDELLETIRRSPSAGDIDLRYVWQPDRGFRLARSRNNAIRLARGRVLVFVDGDTWLAPDFLSTHLEAHADERALVCGLRYTLRTADAAAMLAPSIALFSQLAGRTQHEHRGQRRWLRSSRPWMACLGGNFSIGAAAGVLFDERFESWGSEDRDFAYRAYLGGARPRLLARANAVHVTTSAASERVLTHHDVVSFLHNKRYLARKYLGGEMQPSLELVRFCHLDGDRQRWSMGALRSNATVEDVLAEFDAWLGDASSPTRIGSGRSLSGIAE